MAFYSIGYSDQNSRNIQIEVQNNNNKHSIIHYFSLKSCILLILLNVLLISNTCKLIRATQQLGENGFRCSHKPAPETETVNHVWLNDASFSTEEADDQLEFSFNLRDRSTLSSRNINSKEKRHTQDNSLAEDGSQGGSIWKSMLKKLSLAAADSQPRSATGNELVPMKIQVYYDESVYALETPKQELIVNKVIPSVVEFFESVLSLKQENTIDRFRIARRCPNNTVYYVHDMVGLSRAYCMDRCEDYAICGEMLVPQSHLSACSYCNSTSRRCLTNSSSEGKGVANAQLLLYVSAKQTNRCKRDQTIAYAAHCAQDAKTDRPVAGHANLCPSSISTDAKDLKALIATVKHELTHVLGFSVSLFAYYRDSNGRPLTERDSSPGPLPVDPKTGYAKWSDKIIKKFVRTDWLTGEGRVTKEIHMMVTPTVVREARNHFNCSTLEGAELEDQGSDGTSMTHWEKRLFENEAMTGTHTQNSVYSRISLAVLQDTGWYVANFSRAERLEWGQNLGCDFAKRSCKSWIDERRAKQLSIRPFCDRVKGDLLQIACTEDRVSKAVCNMKQFKEPLPLAYQNFGYLNGVAQENLAYYGGSVDLADYCPFIQEFTWLTQNVSARGSRCDQSVGAGSSLEMERNAALEVYGPQTKCFEHGRRWEQRSCVYKRNWHHFGAGCYRYSCQDGHYSVLVGNHSYHCYYPDQHLHIELMVDQWYYNGTLVCPACDKICAPGKCKSFDRAVIDKILLSVGHSEDHHQLVNISDRSSFEILDESVNFIDSNQNAAKTSDGNQSFGGLLMYKELWQMIFRHKKPPRHSLICSSAQQSGGYLSPLTLIGAIITLVSTVHQFQTR